MGIGVILLLIALYYIIRNAVEDGINRSKLVVGNDDANKDSDPKDDNMI